MPGMASQLVSRPSKLAPLLSPQKSLQPVLASRGLACLQALNEGLTSPSTEEFDFADLFGPLPSPQVDPQFQSPTHASGVSQLDRVDEGTDKEQWIAVSQPSPVNGWTNMTGPPAVIYSRSHSFVGPSLPDPSPRTSSLTWATVNSFGGKSTFHGSLGVPTPAVADALVGETVTAVKLHHVDSVDSLEVSSGDERLSTGSGGEGTNRASDCEPTKRSGRKSKRPEKKYGPEDFELMRVVGQGAFGKVFQVMKKDTGEILAMKVMVKDKIVQHNHGDYMKGERDILRKVVHPFIVQLLYSFQTPSKLYLLLDFINGGHLFFQLLQQGTFSEELAKVYTAEIVSAVAHLHSRDIIHRDLKPENILLDDEGHVKLTDFGLAKEMDEISSTNSLCGTVEYMAPEIITASGHGKAADWWSVGILLFEMLTGAPPFAHNNRQKLQQKILTDKVKLPQYLTADAHSLLKGLLNKDPKKRLGSGPKGSHEIKNHKFFKIINWRKLENKEIQPKFRPTVNGKQCTANFDDVWTRMPAQDSPAPTPKACTSDFFEGYSYVSPSFLLDMSRNSSDSEDEAEEAEAEAT